jgi:hypothetical protein
MQIRIDKRLWLLCVCKGGLRHYLIVIDSTETEIGRDIGIRLQFQIVVSMPTEFKHHIDESKFSFSIRAQNNDNFDKIPNKWINHIYYEILLHL